MCIRDSIMYRNINLKRGQVSTHKYRNRYSRHTCRHTETSIRIKCCYWFMTQDQENFFDSPDIIILLQWNHIFGEAVIFYSTTINLAWEVLLFNVAFDAEVATSIHPRLSVLTMYSKTYFIVILHQNICSESTKISTDTHRFSYS